MLSLDAAADPVEVRRSVERFLAARGAAAHLRTGPELVGAIRAIVGQTRALFDAMTWVVVGGAVLAILNSLTISVLQRRRELGIMRALGTSRRQLRRMVGIEAAVLGTVGGAGGGIIGSLLHRASLGPLMAPLTREAGFPIRYEFLASAPLLALAAGVLIALVASLAPARRAASVVVVSAIGYE
jgi:putative ABC transport system permease protein